MIKLLNNHWLKIVALGIGSLIWLHVATDKTYTYELMLPLSQFTLRSNLVLASPPPDSLLVLVSGTGKQLLRRTWRRDGVRIIASQFSPGRYRMDLNRSNTTLNSAQAVVLEDILSPLQIQLVVDTIASRTLPVVDDITASPADGYAVVPRKQIIPDVVRLSGPRSTLAGIKEIRTIAREFNNLRNAIDITLSLVPPEEHGFIITPDSVTVSIEVVPVKTRIYEDLPIVIFNLPPDKTASSEPATVRVELSGPPEDITDLGRNAITVSVDYRAVDSTGKGQIRVDCPSHFSVRKKSADQVSVHISSDADSGN